MQKDNDWKVNNTLDYDKGAHLQPLAVSVQDISDQGGDQDWLLRKSQAVSVMSRMPTPKFQKESLKASFPESYANELSSSMGKNRELPDDNVLNSSNKLLLSPIERNKEHFDLPTDLNTLDAL